MLYPQAPQICVPHWAHFLPTPACSSSCISELGCWQYHPNKCPPKLETMLSFFYFFLSNLPFCWLQVIKTSALESFLGNPFLFVYFFCWLLENGLQTLILLNFAKISPKMIVEKYVTPTHYHCNQNAFGYHVTKSIMKLSSKMPYHPFKYWQRSNPTY